MAWLRKPRKRGQALLETQPRRLCDARAQRRGFDVAADARRARAGACTSQARRWPGRDERIPAGAIEPRQRAPRFCRSGALGRRARRAGGPAGNSSGRWRSRSRRAGDLADLLALTPWERRAVPAERDPARPGARARAPGSRSPRDSTSKSRILSTKSAPRRRCADESCGRARRAARAPRPPSP